MAFYFCVCIFYNYLIFGLIILYKPLFFWGVVVYCRPPQQLWETLERCRHDLKPFSKPEKVSKIGLLVSDKSLTRIWRLSISQSCCSRLDPFLYIYSNKIRNEWRFCSVGSLFNYGTKKGLYYIIVNTVLLVINIVLIFIVETSCVRATLYET